MRPLRIVRTHQADGTLSPELLTNFGGKGAAKRGSAMINVATVLLLVLAVALYIVSIAAQYKFVVDIKHNNVVSWLEAVSLDGGMVVFSLLAMGLARAGQSARIERLFIVACAIGSAVMNYAAASGGDIRSALAYTLPPLFLAVVIDRTISVIRRHYLGDDDASAWANLGRVTLYVLRFCVAAPSTLSGARRYILIKAPVPDMPVKIRPLPILTSERPAAVVIPDSPQPVEPPAAKAVTAPKRPAAHKGPAATVTPLKLATASSAPGGFTPRAGSKTDQLVKLAAERNGSLADIPLDRTSGIATGLAKEVGLDSGAARTALKKAVKAAHAAAETDEEATA